MSEKTEQPTHKKLRDARQKGQVAKSRDFTQTVLVLALFGYLIAGGTRLVDGFVELIVAPLSVLDMEFERAADALVIGLGRQAVLLTLPFLLIVIVLGLFVEALQTGMLFSLEPLKPSGKRLNMLENAKNMFSKKNLVEFLKSVLKIVFLTAVVTLLVRDSLQVLVDLPLAGFVGVGWAMGDLLRLLMVNVALAYVVISAADLLWQRMQHHKQLMMTKDEVKQEYKQMEGDPHIKHHRRQLHQEMLEHGAVHKAGKASVLVTNPTHLAIALHYDKDTTPLPRVLAKGEGALAERMIAAARAAGVPVLQNIPLAHALFEQAHEEQYIPSDLIEPVAEVLRLVQKMAAGADHDHRTFKE